MGWIGFNTVGLNWDQPKLVDMLAQILMSWNGFEWLDWVRMGWDLLGWFEIGWIEMGSRVGKSLNALEWV